MDFYCNGLKLNYTDEGKGKAVVFIHGWGADLHSFDYIASILRENYRVIRIDLAGHGESEKPRTAFDVGDFADEVTGLLNMLSPDSPTLVGHSNGGRVILYMLGHNGYKAEKAVLIDSAGIVPKRSLAYKVKVAKYKTSKKLIKLFCKKNADEKTEALKKKYGSADYKNADGVMRDTMVKLVNTDLCEYMPNIDVPTLLIWGDADTQTPLSDGKTMEKLIKNSGLAVIEGGSHWAFAEKPYQFVSIMQSFLKS